MSEGTATVVVAMPHMGVSVDEGTVVEWLVAVGDSVTAGQPICAIATDKVDTEVEATADGVVARILVQVDEDVAVGGPLAELAVEGEASEKGDGASRRVSVKPTPTPISDLGAGRLDADAGLAERAAAGRDEFGRFDPVRAARALLSSIPRPSTGGTGGKLASPIARRMANQHGLDLSLVEGSGRGGRVRKADVEAAISSSAAPPAPTSGKQEPEELPTGYEGVPHEVVKTGRVRRVIAEHMVRSRQMAAHMTTEVDVDLAVVVEVRAGLNEEGQEKGEPKLSYLPFIARAACDALGEHPRMNSTFLGERTVLWQTVNLGVAVDTEEGLLVPVVKGCEALTAAEIGAAIADLAERARSRKLVPDDLAGGTFTLSNPGSVGAVSGPAIINQPQVAVLGVPTIQRRPWVVADGSGGETVEVRPILRLAVTFDHRAVDGADATRFAVAVKDKLESWGPEAYT